LLYLLLTSVIFLPLRFGGFASKSTVDKRG
jgi:hypothetical protein